MLIRLWVGRVMVSDKWYKSGDPGFRITAFTMLADVALKQVSKHHSLLQINPDNIDDKTDNWMLLNSHLCTCILLFCKLVCQNKLTWSVFFLSGFPATVTNIMSGWPFFVAFNMSSWLPPAWMTFCISTFGGGFFLGSSSSSESS